MKGTTNSPQTPMYSEKLVSKGFWTSKLRRRRGCSVIVQELVRDELCVLVTLPQVSSDPYCISHQTLVGDESLFPLK